MMSIFQKLFFAAMCLLGLMGTSANACTASETGGVLTSVSSQRIATGSAVTGSGTFNFSCASTLVAVLTTPTLKATVQASTTGLTLKNTTNNAITIPYQVYTDPGNTTSMTGGLVSVNLNGTTIVSLLNTGSISSSVPIYFSTTPGAVVPAGTYTDTVAVTWAYQSICEGGLNVAGLCIGVNNTGSVTRYMTVTIIVTNDCTITAPVVNFGNAPLVSGFPTISQSISVLCSKTMSYTVGMGTGSSPGANTRRRMSSGTNRLEYDIFKADSTVWGGSGTARANGPAVADGVSQQNIPYTARVYTDQTTPPVGNYTDNIVVDVSF